MSLLRQATYWKKAAFSYEAGNELIWDMVAVVMEQVLRCVQTKYPGILSIDEQSLFINDILLWLSVLRQDAKLYASYYETGSLRYVSLSMWYEVGDMRKVFRYNAVIVIIRNTLQYN